MKPNWEDVAAQAAGSGQSADANAAQAIRLEEQRFQELYRPLSIEAINDVDSTRLVDAAANAVSLGQQMTGGRAERQAARLGIAPDALERQETAAATSLNNAVNTGQVLNKARFMQADRNDQQRMEMINLGRGVSKEAMTGLNAAANSEVDRNNANAAAKQQNKNARNAMLVTLAALAI